MDRLRYLLGIVTLVVMVAGGWFLFDQLRSSERNTEYKIRVTFLDARGLKAGADVKYRGVPVGTVRRVEVTPDGTRAEILVTVRAEKVSLVRTNSRFWIVTPRFLGISGGVTGLDTLVRDTYLAFSTPEPYGELLEKDSGLFGEEAPDGPGQDVSLPPVERGDLLMRVLLPENHGIKVGARVMFRGMATGEVRSLALAPSGTHVEVEIRVTARYRATVTEVSVFWVAKPQLNLQFSLSSPVAVNELGSLLSPYLAYYTPPRSGVPVQDNHQVAASLERPAIEVSPVPPAALAAGPEVAPATPTGPVVLVRVVYQATDVDWLSPNDTLHREGTGLLYVDRSDRVLILTARSVCDASYFYRETFGERARIQNEQLVVQLPGSKVLKATRFWPHPGGLDIAILQVGDLPHEYPTTRPAVLKFLAQKDVDPKGLVLHVAGERGVREKPEPFDMAKVEFPDVLGGILMRDKDVIGFVAQTGEDQVAPAIVTFGTIPESLRPKE